MFCGFALDKIIHKNVSVYYSCLLVVFVLVGRGICGYGGLVVRGGADEVYSNGEWGSVCVLP